MPNQRPYLIGITGTISSGKSAVGKILRQRGVPVFDTDIIVHELLAQNNPTQKAVIDRFGASVLNDNATGINRPALAKIVFTDAQAKRDLESIIHPAVILETRRKIAELSTKSIAAVLAPLLFEAGLKGEYDETWAVYTEEAILRERLRARDKMTDEQIAARLNAQWTQQKKMSMADLVIDNSKTLDETEHQVSTRLEKLKAR